MPEKQFKSSFIPKESPAKKRKGRRRSSDPIRFINIIVGFLFIVVVLAAAGVFLYKTYLESSLESKKESLVQAREAFDVDLLEELGDLDKRMRQGRQLLNNHIAPTIIFEMLEESTSQAIRFETFSYTLEETQINISMQGEAESFGAIAHQSDVLGENRSFRDVIFSGLTVNETGGVSFNFSASVDVSEILYTNKLGVRE